MVSLAETPSLSLVMVSGVLLKTMPQWKNLVNRLIVNGLVINGAFLQLSPLYAPSTKVTISNVSPFVADEVLQRELARFGKVVSPFKTISLGCKHPSLRHVVSFRRQVFMMLESNDKYWT